MKVHPMTQTGPHSGPVVVQPTTEQTPCTEVLRGFILTNRVSRGLQTQGERNPNNLRERNKSTCAIQKIFSQI